MSNMRIISGMQPTNNLHLGNYLGALRNWTKLPKEAEHLYFIPDLHAITLPQEPDALRRATIEVTASYIAAGVDPDNSSIFVQSHVPQHSELSWLLGCYTPLGWLNRMTQFKDKAGKDKEKASLGLYSYPVLMAADVLVYNATHVPVGEDQKQHLELARDIAGAFNRRYQQEIITLPEPLIMGEATRVMSLRDGSKKMSKSDASDYSRINLTDSAEDIALKFQKAKSDSEPLPQTIEELAARPEADNLITIYAALLDKTRAEIVQEFAGTSFSQFKPKLTELAVSTLSPITDKMQQLLANQDEIEKILKRGAERARVLAEENLVKIKNIIGFLQP